jgi:hypothetical protein
VPWLRIMTGMVTKHIKIFDPDQGQHPLTDCTVAKRGNRWWMFGADVETSEFNSLAPGSPQRTALIKAGKVPEIQIFSASLPEGEPLSASGWEITPDPHEPAKPAILAGKSKSHWWDGKGGRHCVSYVKGFDPDQNAWVERLYYAGAARDYMGPYVIGYVEWDGQKWVDQPAPAFTANEYWEHGSVYEPNLIYRDGKWKMWYVAGANQDDYLVQGYAESPNGRTDWSLHQVVFPGEEKVFDFCVIDANGGYEAVFSRVNVSGKPDGGPKAGVGLFWCRAKTPSPKMADWSEPVRISEPGPWKPCVRYSETDPQKIFVFYDATYSSPQWSAMPFYFTVDCIEIPRPK